jgi:hypothetical protein
VLRVLIRIDSDSYGKSLHYFDIVAAGVLGRKQAEQRPSGSWKIFDRSFIVAIESIDVNAHGLTGSHMLQLSLLEVRRDPDVVERHDDHQALTRLHPMS